MSLCNRVALETFAARIDGLTGASNRVAFRESLDDEVARAVRAGSSLAWLLPAANVVQARAITERVIAAWEQEADARGRPVRLSIGLAVLNPDQGGADALVKTADAAVYVAKRAGGNRVHMVQVG